MTAIQQALLSDVASGSGGGGTPYGVSVTWNGLDKNAACTLSGGNLTATWSGANVGCCRATAASPAGISVFEVTNNSVNGDTSNNVGICTLSLPTSKYVGEDGNGVCYNMSGDVYQNAVLLGTFTTVPLHGILGVKINNTAGTVAFYVNGVLATTITHGLGSTIYAGCGEANTSGFPSQIGNFGGSSFAYSYP